MALGGRTPEEEQRDIELMMDQVAQERQAPRAFGALDVRAGGFSSGTGAFQPPPAGSFLTQFPGQFGNPAAPVDPRRIASLEELVAQQNAVGQSEQMIPRPQDARGIGTMPTEGSDAYFQRPPGSLAQDLAKPLGGSRPGSPVQADGSRGRGPMLRATDLESGLEYAGVMPGRGDAFNRGSGNGSPSGITLDPQGGPRDLFPNMPASQESALRGIELGQPVRVTAPDFGQDVSNAEGAAEATRRAAGGRISFRDSPDLATYFAGLFGR